jgi:hypothetical protein
LNNSVLKIEPFTSKDLHVVPALQPDGWPDISTSIQFYCGSDFCHPLKAILNGVVVGIGAAILNANTAWLAHIIVNKDYRNRGIGAFITASLIDLVHKTPCRTIQLVATALGEPVYKKLGFEVDAQYVFFDDSGSLPAIDEKPEIVAFGNGHEEPVFQLDNHVSGEDRKKLLKDHLPHAQVAVEKGVLTGVYFPTLGEGLIEAVTPAAGLAMMKLRALSNKKFCIPANNEAGVNLLTQNGFKEIRKASRMILGDKLVWDGRKIYSRIGGNLG